MASLCRNRWLSLVWTTRYTGQLCTPALTTLDNKLGEVSLAAANMLLDVLQERPVSHKLMLLTEIIQREST